MFITEVVIDGFKSYATRTVVGPFDQSFNAITGLNGSGKSNILDAICFVLGIQDLKQVRVGNLQELVYKQGQAGVTRATVSIVFNNEDASLSPVGYEQFKTITVTRQIQVGGKNKYLINGHMAQQHRVQNLFHSVQLNVNNPHFLIMQGRITKVLNMKPPEILGMIEEAAGTRMYESKKASALKTIEKKEAKVIQIQDILAQEIMPMLDKLRSEKATYVEWSRLSTQRERLDRFTIALNYSRVHQQLDSSEREAEKLRSKLEVLQQKAEEEAKVAQGHQERIEELTQQRANREEGELRSLERENDDLSKKLVQHSTAWQNAKEALATELKGQKAADKALEDTRKALAQTEGKLAKLEAKLDALRAEAGAASEAAAEAQKHLQAAQAGMGSASDGGGDGRTTQDRLAAAERDAAAAGTEAKQADMRVKHIKGELKAKAKDVKAAEREYERTRAGLDKAQAEADQLQAELQALAYAPKDGAKKEAALERRRVSVERAVQTLRDAVDELSSRLSAVQFMYSDPERGFDRSKVKGLVAELIQVRDPARHAAALEVSAGGKLYQVVVDSEQTGKLLLERGKLRKRVTIIPLNKISGRVISDERVRAAQNLVGADGCSLALSLIGYEDDVDAAMRYVFGNTLVCEDLTAARRVAFHKDVKARAVTLDGDVFDPAGTLTGGSRTQTASLLAALQKLSMARKELQEKESELAGVEKELADIQSMAERHATLQSQFDVKSHQLKTLKEKAARAAHFQLIETQKQLTAQLSVMEEQMNGAVEREKAAREEAKALKAEIENAAAVRAERVKEREKALADAKKKYAAATKAFKEAEQDRETLLAECAELKSEIEAQEAQSATGSETIAAAEAEAARLGEVAAEAKAAFDESKGRLDAQKSELQACDRDIQKAAKERDRAIRRQQDDELEQRKIQHAMDRQAKAQKDSARGIDALLKQHPWIATEQQYFGQAGTDYDFQGRSFDEVKAELDELAERQNELGKKINRKVMTMIEKAEQEYEELMTKKKIIETDKKRIHDVIDELDEKKKVAVQETWTKVNRDFGSIFSTLLPGASAKLEPPEEAESVMDGLEVKVAFGDRWKESLTELSGGQRSLLALSLVLSLLLFKPAPMYILDEIDAALDLSHTQNIGRLIRSHFARSQFIMVSLKEGMFNNANVLFRTKFVDGVSTVERHESGGEEDAGSGADGAPKRKRGKK